MEINEKKRYKIFGAEILKGYCPVFVVIERLGSRGAGERAGARAGRAWGAQVAAGRWALVSGRWQERTGAQAAAARARGARAGVGAAGRGRARGAAWQGARARRQLGGKRARGRAQQAWARGLGAWAGLGLCTRCTRPIFDPF